MHALSKPHHDNTCIAGVSGLQREDAEGDGKIYALLLADTVVVKAGGGPPDVATALAPKDWKEVAYNLVGAWHFQRSE